MELLSNYIFTFVENGGLLAPILFISFHLLRPLFFLPVVLICISGGILFGAFAGTIYSIIGITLSSILFYFVLERTPKTFHKLTNVRKKLFGKKLELTTSQISMLRLVPFIHFHLLSLCLIEISSNFKDYTKSSIVTNIPVAFIYTSVGQQLTNLSPVMLSLFLCLLCFCIYLFRKKESIIKWKEFFQVSA